MARTLFPRSFRLAFLLAINSAVLDANHFVMYLAFLGSSYGCDFEKIFGITYGISAFTQIGFKFALAPITDAAGPMLMALLQTTSLIQIAIQLVIFIGSFENAWVIVVLELFLWCDILLSQSLVLKLVKAYVEAELRDNAGKQTSEINVLQAWGSFLSTVLMCTASGTAFLVGARLELVKWLFYGTALACSLLTNLAVASLNLDGSARAVLRPFDERLLAAAAVAAASARERAPLMLQGDDEAPPGNAGAVTRPAPSPRGSLAWGYLATGFKVMWADTIVVHVTLVYFLSYAYQYLVYMTATLTLSVRDASTGVKTRTNLCAGTLRNLFLQAFCLNVVYTIGSLGYGAVAARIPPLVAFRVVVPVGGVALAVGTAALTRPMPVLASSVLIAACSFLSYALYLYAGNVGIAMLPQTLTGFYWGFLGVCSSVLLLLPSAFTSLNVRLGVTVAVCMALTLTMSVLSFTFATRRRSALAVLSDR